MLTPRILSELHTRCFSTPRPWSETEFASLLADPQSFVLGTTDGIVLGRVIADEAELLTLAVNPDKRRRGIGLQLLLDYEMQAQSRGARLSFLEVAADNIAANALYLGHGYAVAGRRNSYYKTPEQQRIDALVLSKTLS